MKKTIIVLLGILLFTATCNVSIAKTSTKSPVVASAIKYYKAGNYTQSYVTLKEFVQKDTSNALAFYYLGMSATQLGKKEEATLCYNKASELSPNGILGSYAKRGLLCLENAWACHNPETYENKDDTEEDKFIKSKFGSGFSNKARGAFEHQKMENIKREINRDDDIVPQRFKDYKDFSSQAPTNEEIVSAIRTLQNAGISTLPNNNYYSDLSLLMGAQDNTNNSNYDIYNMLFSNNNTRGSNVDPRIIQSLLTTQMTASF